MSVSYYISNNVSEFYRLTKEQRWIAREAIISVRDTFIVSIENTKLYFGDIDTTVTFNKQGELVILNLSINKDTFKIINHRSSAVDSILEQSKTIHLERTKNDYKKKAVIFYNVMLDSSRSENEVHYNWLVVELARYLSCIEVSNAKKRSNSV